MKRIILTAITIVMTMALAAQSRVVEATLKSAVLNTEKPYTIYLPAGYDGSGKDYPVLYLLHGAWGDHTDWPRKGAVKSIADETIEAGFAHEMIIVMPDAKGEKEDLTGYQMGYFNKPDWAYEDFFFTEFIPHIEKTYRIIRDKDHRAIAGLSMGGYGSAGYAQAHPEMFSSCCPMSGALGAMSSLDRLGELEEDSPIGFVRGATSEQVAALKTVRWYVDCGDDDFLWRANVEFFIAMKEKEIPLQYRMRNGGHNWQYWQTALPQVLTFVSIGFSE